jgi:hypothetical protein
LTNEEALILAAIAALQVKHLIFDFLLQRPYQFRNKGTYGHPGGILHAGLHALGTVPCLLILPPPFGVGLAIVVGEFILHYHIDWTKAQIERWLNLSPERSGHFFLLGTDQLLHQLTYVGIVAILASQ